MLAPFALIRVAAVPLRRLSSLAAPQTAEAVSAVVRARSDLDLLRVRAESHLYKVVPTVTDRKLRAAALQLQRDIHATRLPRLDPDTIARISERLPSAAQEEICTWLRLVRQLDDLMSRGEAILAEETNSRLRPALWATLGDERLSLGIAAASPSLRECLERESTRTQPPRGAASSRLELTLLRYLLRATCKTSPFATFMHLGIVPMNGDDAALSLAAAQPVEKLRVNRGIVARLCRAASENDATLFRPNPSIHTHSPGRVQALAAEQVVLLGWPWRQERVAQFHVHPQVADVLLALPPLFSRDWLVERLKSSGLQEEQARRFAEQLIERELILLPATIDAFDFEPLAEVRATSSALATIADLERAADQQRHAGWQHRIRLDAAVRAAETAALSGSPARHESYRNVFFEESRLEGIAGNAGARARELLTEVGHFLHDQVAIRPEAIRLRDAFERKYGASGICTDVVSFLSEETMRQTGDEDGAVIAAPKGSSLGVTAFVQFSANLAVVNRVYEGVGWLSARHLSKHEVECEWMRLWLESVHAPAEPVDVPLSGHCNDLQTHPRLTRRILAWPGEPIRSKRDGVLPMNDLTLRLDSVTKLLELRDRDGRLVAPVYLGGVLPVPTWGPAYGLTIIGAPLCLLRPDAGSLEEDANVTFHPRQMYQRVVLTRAEWSVRSRFLLESCLAARGFRRLIEIAGFCAEHGIPNVFFVRAENWSNPLRSDSPINARKPTFIDVRNPFCLDVLERTAHDAESIVLTEVLPAHDDAWQMGDDHHVVELQVEMCVTGSG